MRRRMGHALAVGTVLAIVAVSACESVVVNRVGDQRSQAGAPPLTESTYLAGQARTHSVAMCAARAVAPTTDPAAAYLGEPATRLRELVGAAPLADGGDAGATDAIWQQWADDPTLVDPQWDSLGVGEHSCDDGRLYMTLVLRNTPPPLGQPADTSKIVLAETITQNGWRYDRYRNLAAPCSISGYQSFVVGTKVGSSAAATRPLWVKLRGGGVGWFDTDGTPLPTAGVKSEESLATQLKFDTAGLMASVKAAPEGFRLLIVSMCSHDIYAGNDSYDPYNPNLTPDGETRPTTGLTATKAAIQHTQALYPTDDFFLHGTSAGGAGTYSVAWGLQQQGLPPAGLISDSGVVNQAWQLYIAQHGVPGGGTGCQKVTEERGFGVLGRIDRALGDPANQPHLLVGSGRLTVPVLHIWNHADHNVCGAALMPCPLPGGSTPTMQAADCNHEPMRLAIAGLDAGSRSLAMGVCVEGNDTATPCDRHVVTAGVNLVNTDPSQPTDYQAAILTWVRARLADD